MIAGGLEAHQGLCLLICEVLPISPYQCILNKHNDCLVTLAMTVLIVLIPCLGLPLGEAGSCRVTDRRLMRVFRHIVPSGYREPLLRSDFAQIPSSRTSLVKRSRFNANIGDLRSDPVRGLETGTIRASPRSKIREAQRKGSGELKGVRD